MSLVSDVITDIRVELNDSDSTRWTDTSILAVLKQAVRRANRIAQRYGLAFARKSAAVTTTANQAYSSLPDDFDVPIGLYRDDTHELIAQRREDEWERIFSAGAIENWYCDLVNSRVNWNGTPTSAIACTMWYYPTIASATYTTGTTMPWGGRLDDIICRYTATRMQNIDEMTVSTDMALMADFENQIVEAYRPQSPTMIASEGWMGGIDE